MARFSRPRGSSCITFFAVDESITIHDILSTMPQATKKKAASRAIQTELQATIAFAAFDTSDIFERGEGLKQKEIKRILSDHYFGRSNDPDSVGLADQCLGGLNQFSFLFDKEDLPLQTDTNSTGVDSDSLPYRLVLKPTFHCQGEMTKIFVGSPRSGGITRAFLTSKNLSNPIDVSPETLHRHALDVLKNAKKALSLVTSPNCPFHDGKDPSGHKYDDYLLYLRQGMFKLLKGKTHLVDDDTQCLAINLTGNDDDEEEGSESPASVEGDNNNENIMPDNYFFRGFFAFAMWGHMAPQGGEPFKSFAMTTGRACPN